MRELIKKLHKLEIKIRKTVNSRVKGSFRSVFKGTGLEFNDIRSYQYGDDIKTINWSATAKGHDTYVNTYKEEHDQQVMILIDVSGSQEIGKGTRKIDISKEIASLLALVAIRENCQVGALCFTDIKEKYIKPQRGNSFAYSMISSIYKISPKSTSTDLNEAFKELSNVLKKKSVVIILSDFIDEHNYEASLKTLANKHEVILLHISERRETIVPRLGIIPIHDVESNKTVWVNTSSKKFREAISSNFKKTRTSLIDLSKKTNSSYCNIFCHEDYIPKLIELFKQRNRL